jgi:dTDP-4-dehydrorhamnose reductase
MLISNMKQQTLLITGIHGLVGQYLYRHLDNWKGKVVLTGRGPLRLPPGNFLYEEMDITVPDTIKDVFDRHQPSVVIHSAAMAQPDECELDQQKAMLHNVDATKYLLEAAARHRSFFVFLSTDFVFSGKDGPYNEYAIPNPVNFYGETKRLAEQQVMLYGMSFAIVRTVLVYGNVLSGTRSNIISWAKSALEKGQPAKVVGDQLRTTTYAGDLAKALLLIAVKKAGGIWHISGKDALSPWDIALKVADALNLDASMLTKVDASTFQQPAERPLQTPFIIEKARRELGYEPVSFEEGMRIVLNGG